MPTRSGFGVPLMAFSAAIHCSLALALTAPTFTHDVAPIVFRSCAPCHRAGGAGPFPLLTYQDVKKHARQIADVTRRRFMPPWLPEAGYGDFDGERRLTTREIQTIQDWVAHAAPEGPSGELPAAPSFAEGWQLGKPDLVVKASRPFEVPASGPDLFWNFVLAPKIEARRYVRAIEIRVGNPRLLHHANLVIDRTGVLSTHSGGFPGMELALERSVFDLDGHFLFWKPAWLARS